MSGRMTSPPGLPVAPLPVTPPDSPSVAAVVLFTDGMNLSETLSALSRQVYKPDSVLVVGGGEAGERIARDQGHAFASSISRILETLPEGSSYVWLVHGDTQPRPDALSSLVTETIRNDASVSGSKVLVTGEDDRLDSVGSATDAFGEPYSGLDPGELDLEQYDVVREVAFVSPVSMLVRKDLLRGLRGLDPTVPPLAGGLDLYQRARLAGGKVIVVPSSEVFHADGCPADRRGWRQMAGRQRAMLIAYRPVTLAWVLPVGLLGGIADAVGQIFLGRLGPLLDYVRSWLWNLAMLPGTVVARRGLNRIRRTGDEELFRFQVGGSVRLRETGAELGERLSRALVDGENTSLSERARVVWRRPSVLMGLAALVILLIATRAIWLGGVPQTGFSLIPGDDPLATLGSYAGGWNGSGLGSPNPPPPVAALGAAATLVLGGRAGLAAALLTFAALVLGFAGLVRLTRRAGAGLAAGYVAGAVYLGGAAALALFGAGQWPLLIAAGPLPWALDPIIASQPSGRRRTMGTWARGGLAAGFAAAAYPPLLAVIGIGGVLWGILTRRIRSLVTTIPVVILGGVGIAPWVVGGELMALLEAAPVPEIRPTWLWPVSIALAMATATLSFDRVRLTGVAWGGLLAGGGWLLGLIPVVPPGVGLAGLLLASLGAGLLASMLTEVREGRARRPIATVALALLLTPVAITVGQGRAGLPADAWSQRLAFAGAISESADPGRVLILGRLGELPGGSRLAGDVAYRVVDGEQATLEQAYLPGPRVGDVALESAVANLAGATSLRPGAELARFGISWVLVLEGTTALNDALSSQVDLFPRLVDPDSQVLENVSAVGRAVADDGRSWIWTNGAYEGTPASGRVRLADNADPGWGPDWMAVDWANSVAATEGRAVFRADPAVQTAAIVSVAALFVMILGSWWGRSRPPARSPR